MLDGSVVPEGLCAGWLVYDFLINIGQDTSINGQFWRPSAIFRGEVVSPKAMARDLPTFCLAIGGIWGEGFGGVWALPSLSPPHFPGCAGRSDRVGCCVVEHAQ